jgi:hypothetical protein
MAKTTGKISAAYKGNNKGKLSEQVKYSDLQRMENTGKCYILFHVLNRQAQFTLLMLSRFTHVHRNYTSPPFY